jgi:OOP family OmpA-OmpF porin
MSATLYFLSGKDELTAESRVAAEQVYRDFIDRQSTEVWIIGHTDTVGSDAYNEALSLRRADRVRQALLKLGVPAESIVIKGMGKRELLVQTPDRTDEPRNRRVEISVR